jgi:hypothetical protein
MKKTVLLGLSIVFFTACGGGVVISPETDPGNGAGGAGPSTSAASTGTGSTGPATGSSSTGTPAECQPKPDGMGGFMQPTCADLDVLTLSDPVITSADGDAALSPGESATLTVNLNEVAGVGFSYYPGVTFKTFDPGVAVKSEDWLYAILPCQSYPMNAYIELASDIKPNTVITIVAQVAMLNQDCPDAYAIKIPIEVH